MKNIFTLVVGLSIISVQAKTLNEFLSETLLGKRIENIEKLYSLDTGILKDTPAYVEIDEFEFGGLRFKVNVFCRDDECRGYGLWANQIRIKDKSGQLKHRDKAEIFDVFQTLLGQLSATYGQAPCVKLESRCCGCESGPLSQTYIWVNEKYALVFSFHDNLTSHSMTLRQYRRNEKRGEFTAEKDLIFINSLYKQQSGKLPNDWPSNKFQIRTPQEHLDLHNNTNRQLKQNVPKLVYSKNDTLNESQASETDRFLGPYSLALYIVMFAVLFLLMWKKLRRS